MHRKEPVTARRLHAALCLAAAAALTGCGTSSGASTGPSDAGGPSSSDDSTTSSGSSDSGSGSDSGRPSDGGHGSDSMAATDGGHDAGKSHDGGLVASDAGDAGSPGDAGDAGDGGGAGGDSGVRDVGSCCSAQTTPGCDDPNLELCVCQNDSQCCTTAWDQGCALLVQQRYCDPGVRDCVCGTDAGQWAQSDCCMHDWTSTCDNVATAHCGAVTGCF